MKHLKLFESFESGIEELYGQAWRVRNDIICQYRGTDFFTKQELEFFRSFLIKSDKNDFFGVSGTKGVVSAPSLSGERRSSFSARYMPVDKPKNPISIRITRLKDEYFLIEIGCLNSTQSRFSEYSEYAKPREKLYLVDTFEDLKDFLSDIKKYWKDINDSWRPVVESQNESYTYNSELWSQINSHEKKDKLDSIQKTFSENEIINVQAFINSLNNLSLEFYSEDYSQNNVIVIKHYMSLYDLCIYKLEDEWFIVSFESIETLYSVNFLCDQMDSVEKLVKMGTDNNTIEVPFSYFEISSSGHPRPKINGALGLKSANLIRQKIKEYGFNLDYDEILPTTSGSNLIRFWKAVEYSDLSKEAIKFFNVRQMEGRRIVMMQLGLKECQGGYMILNWGLGPELSLKHISFECNQLEGVENLLDDKLSMLGK